MSVADPSTYVKLPAGTRVLFGAIADATVDLKLLKDANAVGATGKNVGYVDATRLIDEETKYIADMPDAPDKEFVFFDDPDDADFQALLEAADAQQAVKIRIEFPNRRWADMIIALGSWTQKELSKGEGMQIIVTGKQNGITRGTTPAA